MMIYIWLGILALTVVIEIITVQLVTIWFSVGALAAFLVAVLGVDSIVIQIVVFASVSLVALIVTRPMVRKLTKRDVQPTNADMVIGKTAVVTETIDNVAGKGYAKVGGNVWTARSEDGSVIEKDSVVTVTQIQGVKLIVTKENKN